MVFLPTLEREIHYIILCHVPLKCDEIKNLPDVKANNLIAERLVERIFIHMAPISLTQYTSLSGLCIQLFQTFDIRFHPVCPILFNLQKKVGKKVEEIQPID